MTNKLEITIEDAIYAAALLNPENTKASVARFLMKIARAVEAIHREAPRTEVFAKNPNEIHVRCILAAHSLRDMLKSMGIAATLVPCSLVVTREVDGAVTHLLMAGTTDKPRSEQDFNGHLVVRCRNFIVDPTSGQAGRPWNYWCKSMISTASIGPLRWTDPETFESYQAFGNGGHRIPHSSAWQHWAYLERPDLADNDVWLSAPDAAPERRRELVDRALEAYGRGVRANVIMPPANLAPYSNTTPLRH